ncbi:MAG: hypothetical protein IPN49_17440 [Saprospiraceae bacterium]|nr:hypothetical protein [Saprospiraceae bacterium]MBK9043556.1 hypothetical protein [Saprospiraceae bacterium]
MDFLYKMAFYVMFGISCILIIYLSTHMVSIFLDAYGKKSEVVIILIGSIILGTGLFKAYLSIQTGDHFLFASGIIGLSWLVSLVVILIGLLFFNGPLKWN